MRCATTMRSTLVEYDILPPIARYMQVARATFAPFPILGLRYAHAQLRSFGASHVRKNTRLSMPAQL